MPIQVIAPIRDQRLQEQLALSQVLAQGAKGYKQYSQEQALVDVLAGMPGQGPKPLNPGAAGEQNALAAALSGGPAVQGPPTAPTPGLMPGISRDEAQSYAQSGLGPVLAQIGLAQRFPAAITPYEQARLGIDSRTADAAMMKAMQPDLSTAQKEAAALGYDLSTPEGAQAYAKWRDSFSSSTTTNVYNAPSGFRTTPEGNLEPIPGGPGERVEGPAAAGMALLPNAIAEIPNLGAALFTPEGSVNRQAVATMNVPGFGAIPGTAGEGYRAAMQAGTMAILRVESGGAITPDEIQAKLDTYMPGPLDTDDVARQKFDRYQRDLNNAQAVISRGRGGAQAAAPVAPMAPASGPVDQAIQSGMQAVTGALPGSPTTPSANISSMSLEQLNALDRSAMSDADLRAAAERYKSLGGM